MKRGVFIVFEGIDGSGKTTQSKLLAKLLRKRGFDVILTKEPTKSRAGILARKLSTIFIGDWIQQVFIDDRTEHLRKIILPAIKQIKIVICDRYVLSSIAYAHDPAFISKLNKGFPKPDLTVILDLPPKVALSRMSDRKTNAFENLRELSRVARNYKTAKGLHIDASNKKEQIRKEIEKKVKKLFFF